MSVRPPCSLSHSRKHQVYFVPRYLTLLLLILVLGLVASGPLMGQLWDVGSAAREPHRVTSGAESSAFVAPVNPSNVDSDPTLGNYPNTLVQLGGNTTITPDAAPTNTTSINVSTSTSFNGKLAADPVTGVVRVTNAHPAAFVAPGFYTVMVKAFSSGGANITTTFTLTVGAGGCGGVLKFIHAPNVSANPYPCCDVAIGDFNNDGKQDLAIPVPVPKTVLIRLGDGAGGFSGSTQVVLGDEPTFVEIGDFNNDGNQDFAIVGSDRVWIRLGDGLGGFSGTTEVSAHSYPSSVAIGDFNNDGKQDLAAPNIAPSRVSIRLGDGAGGFSGTTEVAVGGRYVQSIAIGDFNNDGNLDFATGNCCNIPDTVSIRLGDGAGGFSATTEIAVGSFPFLAIGDLNNDGKQDLAVTKYNENSVSILSGDGFGGFSATAELAVGSLPRSVAMGDFNNDGNPDLVTGFETDLASGHVAISLGDGAGGFSGPTWVSVGRRGLNVAIGDFNNDGKQDLATANIDENTVSIVLGQCSLTNYPPAIAAATGLSRRQNTVSNSQIASVTDDGGNGIVAVTVTSANPANGVTITNIVNKGGNITADIAASCGASNASFTLQASDASLTATDTLNLTVTASTEPCLRYASPQSVHLGGALNVTPAAAGGRITGYTVQSVTPALATAPTVDASGIVSIANAQPVGPHTITIRATDNNGATTDASFGLMVQGPACTGVSTFTNAADVSVGTEPTSIAIGDFNNDSKQDFAVVSQTSNTVSIRLGDGAGGFSGTTELFFNYSHPYSVAIGDFNHDGNQDIAVANYDSNTVSIRLGDGLGGFSGTTEVSVGKWPNSVAIGDFNNDGKQDFAVANYAYLGTVSIRLGNGLGGFSGTTEVSVGKWPSYVAIGDFNNDGKQDFATSNNVTPGRVSIRLGNGQGGFSGTTEVSVGSYPYSPAIGDFNNDGNQDFATANDGSDTVSIRLGNGSGGFSGTTEVILGVGSSPHSLAIGDFNNDGKPDLAVQKSKNVSSGTVLILLGDGLGGFSGTTETSVGRDPTFITIGDFNNDGRQDFAAANFFNGSTTVVIRLGQCSFPPTIAAATGLSRPQNSVSNSQIATVTDEGGNGNVVVTVTSSNPANGVTLSNIVNTNGNITADIAASCGASNANFTLQASDGTSTATDTLTITVTPSATPCLFYASPQSVTYSGSLNVAPTAAGGTITSYTVQSVVPALKTPPTVDSSGIVSINNAQPPGPHTITVRATDNNGATTDASFRLMVQAPTCTNAATFTSAPDVSAGNAPQFVAGGDFNHDGNVDLAVANAVSNTVSIRMGNGAGGFSGTTEVSVGASPHSVAIGDFNNDGQLDLAAANYDSNTVSIRLGDGAGGFSGTTEVSVGAYPYAVAIGDFNNDGKPDLATANRYPGTVSIRLGDGAGGFSGTTSVAVGLSPRSIAIADFNNDGKQDLATANNMTSGTVSIRLGNGLGGFSGSTEVSVGSMPGAVAIGDFNQDGKPDLAVANYVSNTVSIRLGNGTGGFGGTTEVAVGSYPRAVAFGDFNNDGKPDVATANTGSSTVSIRLGDGAGGFSGAAELSVGWNPYSITIADFNNDGTQDFATANAGSHSVSIGLGYCDPPPTIVPATLLRPQNTVSNLPIATVTDDNGNGNVVVTVTSANPWNGVTISNIVNTGGLITADIAASCGASNATFILRASNGYAAATDTLTITVIPSATPCLFYASPQTVSFGASLSVAPKAAGGTITGYTVQSVSPALTTAPTVDATGIVAITNAQPPGLHTITIRATDNNGATTDASFRLMVQAPACTGASTFTHAADVSAGAGPQFVAIGDFNNDGNQDLATGRTDSNTVSIRLGDGAGGFSGSTEVAVGAKPASVVIADFNNDGKQDLATANFGSNTVSIRIGDGAGGFSGTTEVSVDWFSYSVATADFNHDGNQDLAAANYYSSTVSIRLGNGAGGFSGTTQVNVGSHPRSIAIGNFNNDGNQDFATANNVSGTVSIRLGNGTGGFSGTTEVSVGAGPISIAVGDFNHDGKQDFAAANYNSNTVSLRLGNGSGGFSGTTNVTVGSSPRAVAIGDFNNDGKLDIATANDGSGTVSISLGDGAGGFSGAMDVSVGWNPYSVAIGDFNNDGKQDFASANAGSNTVAIRLGQCEH